MTGFVIIYHFHLHYSRSRHYQSYLHYNRRFRHYSVVLPLQSQVSSLYISVILTLRYSSRFCHYLSVLYLHHSRRFRHYLSFLLTLLSQVLSLFIISTYTTVTGFVIIYHFHLHYCHRFRHDLSFPLTLLSQVLSLFIISTYTTVTGFVIIYHFHYTTVTGFVIIYHFHLHYCHRFRHYLSFPLTLLSQVSSLFIISTYTTVTGFVIIYHFHLHYSLAHVLSLSVLYSHCSHRFRRISSSVDVSLSSHRGRPRLECSYRR